MVSRKQQDNDIISDLRAEEYFDMFDRDEEGCINVKELAELIRQLDNRVGEADLARMIRNVEEINKPNLTF
jgi:Ca2+-binding EF-hand superfamily protein